jgi:hypothetical protein
MPTYLTQTQMLTLKPYPPKSIYLRWLSPLNMWEGWLFSGDFDPKTNVDETMELSSADGRAAVAVRWASTDTLTVRAGDLSEAQWLTFTTIFDSPQVYRQYANGQRIPVLVAASAMATRTSSDGRYTFDLDIKLPSRTNALPPQIRGWQCASAKWACGHH